MTKYNPKSCINSEKWTKFVPQHIWTCRSWSPHGCKLNEAYIYSSIVSIVFTLTSHLVYVKCDVNILNSSNHLYNQRYAHFWRTWLCSVTKNIFFHPDLLSCHSIHPSRIVFAVFAHGKTHRERLAVCMIVNFTRQEFHLFSSTECRWSDAVSAIAKPCKKK